MSGVLLDKNEKILGCLQGAYSLFCYDGDSAANRTDGRKI